LLRRANKAQINLGLYSSLDESWGSGHNRRVISSRIFIKRDTEEMNMDKVETVDISQTIPGRLLDYGTIRIMGTGGTNDITVERIAAPYSLRSAITAR